MDERKCGLEGLKCDSNNGHSPPTEQNGNVNDKELGPLAALLIFFVCACVLLSLVATLVIRQKLVELPIYYPAIMTCKLALCMLDANVT